MKKLKFLWVVLSVVLAFSAVSCKNQPWEFPDYDYTTTYFAYQYPVRTLVLGEDLYDTTLDNEHKCLIMATMGGVYSNEQDRILDVSVDESLTQNLFFANADGSKGAELKIMPTGYYSLPDEMTITIPKGKVAGAIEVQLTDAFFNDPEAIKNTYVIPLRIDAAERIDSILVGSSTLPNPNVHVAADWSVRSKDYILYCVKYINPWDFTYLRRGVDQGTGKNEHDEYNITRVRHADYIERNEVCETRTLSMSEIEVSLRTMDINNEALPFTMIVKFDEQGNCSVRAVDGADYTITGSGKFEELGDKNSWGNEDRNWVCLDYTVDFENATYAIRDTLTQRDRGLKLETFTPFVGE